MRDIIFWYNQNKKKILGVLGTAVIVVVTVQSIKWTIIHNQNNQLEKITGTVKNEKSNFNAIELNSDKSSLTSKEITTTQKKLLNTIDKFVEYCNNSQISEAYNLLTDECKKEMYPQIDNFKEQYYNNIFSGEEKIISVENWIGNIYKVKFSENALSTGKYNTDNIINDYITIVTNEEGNAKLNINGYIEKKDIKNKQAEQNGIGIKVLEEHQYIDYDTYVFEITNNSKQTILLNDIRSEDINNQNTMYLEDKNGIKYTAYLHELSYAEMKILPGERRNISIKYYNKYSSSKEITSVVFLRIVLNYDNYTNDKSINQYNNYGKIQINL